MFRHKGRARTVRHNLRIASLLSLVAGSVNVVGFLSVQRLTTNVTGHFAFFIDEVFKLNFLTAISYFLYIFFFFLGSFSSGFLIEWNYKRNSKYVYVTPVLLESSLLIGVALFGDFLVVRQQDVLVFLLLFAMGLQNSLVTKISNSVVRTTHLTGLFTDLGIELSQLFFYTQPADRKKLFSSVKLRLTIISFFFVGGVAGGLLYGVLQLYTLILSGVVLIFGVVADYLKFKLFVWRRNYRSQQKQSTDN